MRRDLPVLTSALCQAGAELHTLVCAVASELGTMSSMIGAVTGTARASKLVMTSSGVGYTVTCPEPLVVGEVVDLLVTTVVREDAITLYGFRTAGEQDLFECLTKVPGVGAAIAMAVLADVGVDKAISAIVNEDAAVLAKARGLGIKKAGTICATVKLPAGLVEGAKEDTTPPLALALATTLGQMGYDEAAALAAARHGLASSQSLGDALKAALAHLRGEVG